MLEFHSQSDAFPFYQNQNSKEKHQQSVYEHEVEFFFAIIFEGGIIFLLTFPGDKLSRTESERLEELECGAMSTHMAWLKTLDYLI